MIGSSTKIEDIATAMCPEFYGAWSPHIYIHHGKNRDRKATTIWYCTVRRILNNLLIYNWYL